MLARGICATIGALSASCANAQSVHERPITAEAAISVVSDYRFRGVSLSDDQPALQGEATVSLASGTYLDLWGSAAAHHNQTHDELDIAVGHRFLVAGVEIDASVVRYGFPAADHQSYWEIPVSVDRTLGHWTGTVELAYAPAQRSTGRRGNWYVAAQSEWQTSRATLIARVGYENGALARQKIDWTLGIQTQHGRLTFGLRYVGYVEGKVGGAPTLSTELRF